jgi:hypothetical protein
MVVSGRRHNGADRRRRHRPRFPDRRSGFDRRTAGLSGWRRGYDAALRAYAQNRFAFWLVLATIVVFNYVDYLLTFRVLRAGGVELNPIMVRLFELSPTVAAAVKLGTVGAAVLFLLVLRRYRRTLEVSLVMLAVYTALMFYHALLALRLPA